jgi:hypothetical protein
MNAVYLLLALLPGQVNPASYVSPVNNSPSLRQMLLAESHRQRPLAIQQTEADLAKVEKKLGTLRGLNVWAFLQPPRNADAIQECERTIEILHDRLARLQKDERACIPVLNITDWHVGRAGLLGFHVKVKEVRGPEEMLVEPMAHETDPTSPDAFLIRGYGTAEAKVGQPLIPAGYFAVTGTTFEPTLFSQKAVFVVEAVK